MKWFSHGSIAFWFILVISSLSLLACDVGSLVSQGNAPKPTDVAAVQPTGPASAQPTQVASTQSKDPQTRISSSIDLILQLDKKVFDSYHFDVTGTEPVWNKDKNAVVSEA